MLGNGFTAKNREAAALNISYIFEEQLRNAMDGRRENPPGGGRGGPAIAQELKEGRH